ncbi:MAG: hypothetical protein SPJ29_04055, partial [Phocaeicola sp.]|nr:hypothetical protein [Phocaeicola sp.]
WFINIKLQKISEITAFYSYFLIPNSSRPLFFLIVPKEVRIDETMVGSYFPYSSHNPCGVGDGEIYIDRVIRFVPNPALTKA